MNRTFWTVISLILLGRQVLNLPSDLRDEDGAYYHTFPHVKTDNTKIGKTEFKTEYWINNAQNTLKQKLSKKPNTNIARNVIMFLGDGMSIPTLATTRVYLGGEEENLSFEKFPYTALSKTYCVDRQVADSACTATAYLAGIKTNFATIGVTAAVDLNNCDAMADPKNHVSSIGRWFQQKNKKVGLVSTAKVTDASPTGVYAHTAQRRWESDTDVIKAGADVTKCPDIAHQLIYGDVGKELYVILGGGRAKFMPKTETDEDSENGMRSDGRNLIKEWLKQKNKQNKKAVYISNRKQLLHVSENTEYVMGLFASGHMPYNLDMNKNTIPSLEEMTEVAINILSRNNPEGYFLFVEGARIDHGHHDSKAKKALDETVEFAKAVERAVTMTSEEDTLIVVTADHAHTMSYSGYASRHNDILGVGGEDREGFKYLTLNYANGPGYKANKADGRYKMDQDDTTANDYQFPSIYPLDSETHGGDDVAIFARGPWAHLYSGVIEQNVIPHVMAYAACVGDGHTACNVADAVVARGLLISYFVLVICII